MNKIMVVDDDQIVLDVIRSNLELNDLEVLTATDPNDALDKMNGNEFDLALVDLMLNGNSGLDLMENLHRVDPELPIIILTGYGTINGAVEAMKKGACSYLTKPFDFDELLLQIKNCIEKRNLTREVKRLRNIVNEKYGLENIIGKSDKIKNVLTQAAKAAESNSIVCITGESGTGKELIAKNLHLASPRRAGPYVVINCAAIPETLLESELFGYRKGAFTGADQNKTGLLAEAQGGTLFLDEISEMPVSMQAKLLRVLEEKLIVPVGGNKAQKIDARFLVASNKNLEAEVGKGNFREDLFYRIHVIPISLPPLRDRKEDIPLFAHHFLDHFSRQFKKKMTGFSQGALLKLIRYNWPGNVRELKNAVEVTVLMADSDQITEDMILPSKAAGNNEIILLKDAKENFEKNYLIQLMQATRGNVTQSSKFAGKYRADLYELLKKHNVNPAEYRA